MPEIIATELEDEFLSFQVDEIVTFYTLDATAIGGGLSFFVDRAPGQGAAVFDGVTYQPVPIETEGWEWSGTGPPPDISLTIGVADDSPASVSRLLLAQLEALDDLVGAEVRRVQTLRRHLDDGDDPDPSQVFGVEAVRVEQKTSQAEGRVSWVLKNALDHEGAAIPARRCTNRCTHRYRVPNGVGGFDYSRATCPYTGAAAFDLQGDPVAAADDACGKLIRDCKARFGNAALPFQGFPGVGRFAAR